MSAHGPKDLLVRVNETLDDFEKNSCELLHLANEFKEMAERNLALVDRIRKRTRTLDDPDDEMKVPDAINPQKRKRNGGGALDSDAGERVAKAVAAALDDAVEVTRADAA